MAHCALPHEVRQERAERPADLVQLFLKSRYVGVMGVCIFGSEMRPSRFRRLSLSGLQRDYPLHIVLRLGQSRSIGAGQVKVVRTCGLHEWRAIIPIRIARGSRHHAAGRAAILCAVELATS